MCFENKSLNVLWLPRYFHYSKVVIQVKFTGTGDDRSINNHVTLMLTSSSLLWKNQKGKKRKQKEEEVEDDENIKEKIVKLWFEKLFLKQSKKGKKTYGY